MSVFKDILGYAAIGYLASKWKVLKVLVTGVIGLFGLQQCAIVITSVVVVVAICLEIGYQYDLIKAGCYDLDQFLNHNHK